MFNLESDLIKKNYFRKEYEKRFNSVLNSVSNEVLVELKDQNKGSDLSDWIMGIMPGSIIYHAISNVRANQDLSLTVKEVISELDGVKPEKKFMDYVKTGLKYFDTVGKGAILDLGTYSGELLSAFYLDNFMDNDTTSSVVLYASILMLGAYTRGCICNTYSKGTKATVNFKQKFLKKTREIYSELC